MQSITTRSLCCDCLERITGLSGIAVRRWLLTASRAIRLDTWTPCQSCGALDETYRIAGVGMTPKVTRAPADASRDTAEPAAREYYREDGGES